MFSGQSKYSRLLSPELVSIHLTAQDKATAIDEVVDLLSGHPAIGDLSDVRTAVHNREEVMSTGVGLGLALPHAKTGGVTETVAAFGIKPEGIEFDSVDGLPVQLIFLLVGPVNAQSEHIRILSWISRLMNRAEFREALLAADSAEQIISTFESAEVLPA